MSTRCQIGFYEHDNNDLKKPDALLYRHSDGYPGKIKADGSMESYGVLPHLVPFLRLFQERRGLGDTEYAAAWTLHHLVEIHRKQIIKYKQESTYASSLPADGIDCIGFGICKDFHYDIEYYYAVRYNADLKAYRLEVYQVPFDMNDNISFRLIQTVSLSLP